MRLGRHKKDQEKKKSRRAPARRPFQKGALRAGFAERKTEKEKLEEKERERERRKESRGARARVLWTARSRALCREKDRERET